MKKIKDEQIIEVLKMAIEPFKQYDGKMNYNRVSEFCKDTTVLKIVEDNIDIFNDYGIKIGKDGNISRGKSYKDLIEKLNKLFEEQIEITKTLFYNDNHFYYNCYRYSDVPVVLSNEMLTDIIIKEMLKLNSVQVIDVFDFIYSTLKEWEQTGTEEEKSLRMYFLNDILQDRFTSYYLEKYYEKIDETFKGEIRNDKYVGFFSYRINAEENIVSSKLIFASAINGDEDDKRPMLIKVSLDEFKEKILNNSSNEILRDYFKYKMN